MASRITAAIMAGGKWKGEPPTGFSSWRALTPLADRPLISYVVDALQASEMVDDLLIIGPPELESVCPDVPRLDASDYLTANVTTAATHARDAGKLLLVGCDIPLLSAGAVDRFLEACKPIAARVHYSVIGKDDIEAQFPGMRRTYIRVKSGLFTGGNLILAEPGFLLEAEPRIQALFNARKRPMRLARLLGGSLVIRLALTAIGVPALDIDSAARLVGRTVNAQIAGVITHDATIGADLDSVDEIPYYESLLSASTSPAGS